MKKESERVKLKLCVGWVGWVVGVKLLKWMKGQEVGLVAQINELTSIAGTVQLQQNKNIHTSDNRCACSFNQWRCKTGYTMLRR